MVKYSFSASPFCEICEKSLHEITQNAKQHQYTIHKNIVIAFHIKTFTRRI